MNFDTDNLCKPCDYDGHTVAFYQKKADGLRALVTKDSRGKISVMTRSGKTDFAPDLMEVLSLKELLQELPWGTALDCELYAEGVQATDVKTLVIERSPKLQLGVFAVPWWGGEDWRDEDVEEALYAPAVGGWETLEVTKLPRIGPLSADQVSHLLDIARATKSEGYVLKLKHYDFWYKLKPVRTVDAIVMDVTKSTSNTKFGMLKAVQVGVFGSNGRLVDIASVGTGFDDEFRKSVDIRGLIGRVCEVAFDSIAGQGKLKFPRFVRWRDDKPLRECTMEQLK